MIENLMILGKRILELRKRHSMTQEKLANEMGVSIGAVSKWETTEYGAEYFVYKPFSFEHLQAAIKAIL